MLPRNAGWGRATTRFALAACLAAGCSHAWDDLDPRLGASTAATGPGGSTTATSSASVTSSTGEGGATTASSSSGSGATGGGGAGGAGTGSTSSSGGGGSGGQAPTCAPNGTSTLTEDFEGAVFDPKWIQFENLPVTLEQTGGELVITLGSSAGGDFYSGIRSNDRFDLTACHVLVEATAVPDPATEALGAIQVLVGPDDYIEFLVANGVLAFKVWTAGTQTFYESIPYDALAHRWWRIREEAGFILYETSPDGTAWDLRSTVANTHVVSSVSVGLVAGMYTPEPIAPGPFKLDNLNIAP